MTDNAVKKTDPQGSRPARLKALLTLARWLEKPEASIATLEAVAEVINKNPRAMDKESFFAFENISGGLSLRMGDNFEAFLKATTAVEVAFFKAHRDDPDLLLDIALRTRDAGTVQMAMVTTADLFSRNPDAAQMKYIDGFYLAGNREEFRPPVQGRMGRLFGDSASHRAGMQRVLNMLDESFRQARMAIIKREAPTPEPVRPGNKPATPEPP